MDFATVSRLTETMDDAPDLAELLLTKVGEIFEVASPFALDPRHATTEQRIWRVREAVELAGALMNAVQAIARAGPASES